MTLMTLLLAGSGWLVAALALGLYVGERGRRQDAQRREGVLRVDPAVPAVVTPTAADRTGVPPALVEDLRSAREKYVREAESEGWSPDIAGADFDRMVTSLGSDTGPT